MANALPLEIVCEDFLKDNRRLYAHKAKRKKIALIAVEAVCKGGSGTVTIDLGAAELVTDKKRHGVEPPDRLIRRFSEFTWDFLFFLIVDFHPVLSLIDLLCLLGGPLYNRRLRRQLRLLSDGEMTLGAGERKKAILGFRGLRTAPTHLRLSYRCQDGTPERIECAIG